MSIYLHRYEISKEWINSLKVVYFRIKPEVAAFFKQHTSGKYTKEFKIATVSPFIYDDFNEVDFITFSQGAITGDYPTIYAEESILSYQYGIEKKISGTLTHSMKEEWANFSREIGNILEYEVKPLVEIENKEIMKKVLAIRIAKKYASTEADYEIVKKLLSTFMDKYQELVMKMPKKYYVSRSHSKIELISEVVKIEKGRAGREKYFCYRQELNVVEINQRYYLELKHGIRRLLLQLRNKSDELFFYRDNRTVWFTRDSENGYNLSSISIDKKSKKKVSFRSRETDLYSEYIGLKEYVEDFSYQPEKYLNGDVRIFIPYQPEDATRLNRDAIKTGSSLVERFLEYIMYQAKMDFLKPVNNEIEELELNWRVTKDAKDASRTLYILENHKEYLKDKKELRIGIVYREENNYEEVINEAFKTLSTKPEKLKNAYIYTNLSDKNLYEVIESPNEELLFKIRCVPLKWDEKVFGDLTDFELENIGLREGKVKKWIGENCIDAILIGTDDYSERKERTERDPKKTLRRSFSENNKVNQFFYHSDASGSMKEKFKNSILDILSRYGFVQNIIESREQGIFSNLLFFDILRLQVDKRDYYYLFVSKMTDKGLKVLINNNKGFIELQDIFLDLGNNLKLRKALTEEEIKDKIMEISRLTNGLTWFYPKRYEEFLPERNNKILYTPGETLGTTIQRKGAVSKVKKAFKHFSNEVFIVPDKLVTDQGKYSDTMRQENNSKPHLTRSKLLLEIKEEHYSYIIAIHLLMYVNAQFSSATNLPYPIHSTKYLKEIINSYV